MRHRIVRISINFLIPAVLAVSVFGIGTPRTAAPQRPRREPAGIKALMRHVIPGTRDLPLIVELTDPGVLEMMTSQAAPGTATAATLSQGRSRARLNAPETVSYRAQLKRTRDLMTTKLGALNGVQVEASTELVINSLFVRAPVEQYDAIRRMSGVKKVYFSRLQHMDLNAAKDVVNAAGLWTAAGGQANAGQGVNIGIIDTGIDVTHPMFADTTTLLPTGFPKYDTAADLALTNHKVIVARNFVQMRYGYNSQTINSAVDEVGHGTFNAGVSAGKLVTAYDANVGQISGMAPGAFLGNYKVFGTPGTNDGATTEGIIAAIEQAFLDGMNVLSISLGGLDWVPPSEDPEVTAISNITAAGVVVVVAAGNEGPDPHTVSSPGGSPDAITVGAVWNSRALGPALHVTGPTSTPSNLQNVSYFNEGPRISSAIPLTLAVDVASLDGTGLACAALTSGSLSGNIAFIARGQCAFSTKVTNASGAGARAVIVYDNVPGEAPDYVSMAGLSSSGPPVMLISYADGLNLKTFLAANPGTRVSVDVSNVEQSVPTTPGILAWFSSRGPSADFGIKPDLSAVGVNVYSATQNTYRNGGMYSTTQYTYGDGTSFSTPMVAGAAAGIRQLFPNLTAAQVKSVIVNTASPTVTIDGTNPAMVVQTGAGLLNMGNAAAAGAIFSPVSLNFGVQSYSGSITTTLPLTITNTSGGTDQYTISLRPLVAGPSISLSATNTGPVANNQSATINVTIQAAAPLSGGFQGYISVQSAWTSMTYSVPYWAGIYVPDSSRVLKVSQSATGQNVFSNLKDALAAANPGNVIEFADSQTYTLPSASGSSLPSIMISTNAQGLPLHGITIRAAAGQNPILDGSTASAYADLQVVGAQGVLIQGLTINGGDVGIDVYQPAASVPTSVTIDRCTLTNQTASSYSEGVYVENGGDVSITNSTILSPEYLGVDAEYGARVTMSGSTVQGSQNYGIGAFESNVDVINSTITANLYAGASLTNCSGTVTKSTFSYNSDPAFGDGLDLFDGAMTVTGNTFIGNASAGICLLNDTGSGPTGRIERNTFQSNAEYGIQSFQSQNMQIIANFIADGGVGVETYGSTTATLINNIIVRSVYPSNPPGGYQADLGWGNGVYADESSSIGLVNNTIYSNQLYGIVVASGTNAAVSVQNTIVSQNKKGDLSNLTVRNILYSFIGDGSITGSSNRRGNPNFNNPSGNDFSLAAGSAAIDVGNNAAPNLPFLDYNQQFRVASAGQLPGAGIVDMGAIESGSSYPMVFPLLVSGTVNGTGTGLDNSSFTTAFAAVNPPPTSSATQPTFTAYNSSGLSFSSVQTPTPLAPEAHFASFDYQLFNYAHGASKLGAVLASSIQKLLGFFLIFDPTYSHLADGTDVSADTYTDFYFMRHESDASGQATYQIFNPGVNDASITALAYDSFGNVLANSSYPPIPAKGQYLFAFNSIASSSGYVHVTSTQPVSGLEIFGNSAEIAALRAAPAGTEARLFFPHFAVNQGYSSLIGVVNTSALFANLTLTAYRDDGSILGTPAQRQVNGNGQLLESASSLFGLGSGGILTGYVIVTSDQPGITGFSAFNYASGNISSVSAVPSQSVPQPMLIFSHIANQWPSGTAGDNYLTGIALLNPYGTQVGYLMKVFDGSGNEVAEKTDTLGPYQKVSRLLSWPTPGAGFFTQSIQLGSGHIEVTALDPTTGSAGYQLLGFEMFFTTSLSQLAAVMAQFPN